MGLQGWLADDADGALRSHSRSNEGAVRGRDQSAPVSRRCGNDNGDRRSSERAPRCAAARPSHLHDDREVLPTGRAQEALTAPLSTSFFVGMEIDERLPHADAQKRSTSLFATRNSTICRLTNCAWSSTTWMKTSRNIARGARAGSRGGNWSGV